jgi:hypothetical protein
MEFLDAPGSGPGRAYQVRHDKRVDTRSRNPRLKDEDDSVSSIIRAGP